MVLFQKIAKEEHEGKIYETIEEWDDLDDGNPETEKFIKIISKTEMGDTNELKSDSLLSRIKLLESKNTDFEARIVELEAKTTALEDK